MGTFLKEVIKNYRIFFFKTTHTVPVPLLESSSAEPPFFGPEPEVLRSDCLVSGTTCWLTNKICLLQYWILTNIFLLPYWRLSIKTCLMTQKCYICTGTYLLLILALWWKWNEMFMSCRGLFVYYTSLLLLYLLCFCFVIVVNLNITGIH